MAVEEVPDAQGPMPRAPALACAHWPRRANRRRLRESEGRETRATGRCCSRCSSGVCLRLAPRVALDSWREIDGQPKAPNVSPLAPLVQDRAPRRGNLYPPRSFHLGGERRARRQKFEPAGDSSSVDSSMLRTSPPLPSEGKGSGRIEVASRRHPIPAWLPSEETVGAVHNGLRHRPWFVAELPPRLLG